MSTQPGARFDGEALGSTVLVGIDGRDGSVRVLEAAGRLAQLGGLEVVVALVQKFGADLWAAGAEARAEVEQETEEAVFLLAASVLDPIGVRWRFALARGVPADGLNAIADACDAAVVVVGTRGSGPRSRLRRLISGSVSGTLVHCQRRPVLVIPPIAREPGRDRDGARS